MPPGIWRGSPRWWSTPPRPDTGKLILQPEPFALRDLIDAVAQSLKARADAKSLGVEISIADDLPARVSADAVRLRSALENLIDNAVKFTERGRVSLAVAAAPRRAAG